MRSDCSSRLVHGGSVCSCCSSTQGEWVLGDFFLLIWVVISNLTCAKPVTITSFTFHESQLRKASHNEPVCGCNTQNPIIGNFQELPVRSVLFSQGGSCASLEWAHWAGFFASGQLGAWQHRLCFGGACHLAWLVCNPKFDRF